ncbi:MAG TPA: BtrH N-terminal domain-containing protein [Trueperaceae bacterium]|nr:BtrH N-terminal domain-containing protein [Trueperaceae bacterium]
MTKQRSLKRLVRERMERTGESYTTAHRLITSKRPENRPSGLHQSYPEAGYSTHRESALVRRLLASAGLDLSEAMVCGLGGGIGFMYAVFQYKAVPHPLLTFVAQHHPRPWIEEVADNLEASLSSVTSSSAKVALDKLGAALDTGDAVQITVGKGGLPWIDGVSDLESAEPYTVNIVGMEGSDFLVDDCSESVQRATADALAQAWSLHKKGRFAIQTLRLPADGRVDLIKALRSAVGTTVAHMTGPVLGNAFDVNFGLSGLDKWATEVTDDRSKKGWPARFGNGAGFEHAMGRVAECFTYSYSAPGATRPIYAEFLQEAAGASPLALEPAAQLAAQNGQLWEEVVEVAAAATDPTTAFTRIGQLARTLHAEETKLVEALDVAVSA